MALTETPKALQAFNDYLAMGDDRSLEKLLARYQTCTETAPTLQLTTLKVWSTRNRWQERLAEIAERERAAIIARGIADRQNRVDSLNEMWARMHNLVQARADSMRDVPGGETGLIVRQYKRIGSGKDAETVEEYAFDAALFREMREHAKQAAQELGQWEEKSAVSAEHFVRIYERDGDD